MPTDKSASAYRCVGMLFPRSDDVDPRTRLLASGSYANEVIYTQAGPRAGTPEPATTNSGRLNLEATGELTAALTADLEVRILNGGMPGPSGSASTVWMYDGDTRWRGWDPPCSISDFEGIEWTDGSGGGGQSVRATSECHSLGLPNGKVIEVYRDRYNLVSNIYRVMVKIRSTTGTWTEVVIYSSTTAPGDSYSPCLWRVPAYDDLTGGASGAIYLAHWIEDTTNSTTNIRIYRSIDDAATWTLVQRRGLETDIDTSGSIGVGTAYDVGRIRVAYKDGQAMLVASLYSHDSTAGYVDDLFVQCASADEGYNFKQIAIWDKTATGPYQGGKYHELLVVKRRFTLIYLTHDSTAAGAGRPVYRQTASAFEDLRNDDETAIDTGGISSTWGTISSLSFTDGDLAACVDWDGTVYVYGREAGDVDDGIVIRSRDGMLTWEYMGTSSTTPNVGRWWYGRDTATSPKGFTVAPCQGRILLVGNHQANTGNEDDSLTAIYLGGHTTYCLPDLDGSPRDFRRVGFERTWLPYDLPEDVGWGAATTAGAFAYSLMGPGRLNIATTAGQTHWSLATAATTPTQGYLLHFKARVNSGGSMAADAVAVRLAASDGANGYDISIRLSTSAFEVYNNLAAAVIGSTVNINLTGYYHFIVAFSGSGAADGSITVLYRAASTNPDRNWSVCNNGAALVSGVLVADLIQWGVGLAGNVTADADFQILQYSNGAYTGTMPTQLAPGQDSPDEQFGAPLTASPYPLEAGVMVMGRTGPAAGGDTFTIPTAYDYPVTHLLPEIDPSPRHGWRSTSDSTELKIALELSSLADHRTPRDTIVVALFGVQQRLAYLEGRTVGSGAWVALATLNAAYGMDSVAYTRTGHSIEPDTTSGSAQTPWLHKGDLVGGYARLGTNRIRPILDQTSGAWQTTALSGTFTRPQITLGDVDSGDATSGSAQLWSPNVAAVVHLAGAKYGAYRLRIPSQETPNGYFQIGTLFMGYVQPFATVYDWGRGVEYADGTLLEEMEDGSDVVFEASPGRRTFEVSWNAVDSTGTWSLTAPSPDYVMGTTTANARALGSPQAVAQDLEGLFRACRGRRYPLLYLPYVTKGSPDSQILTSRQDFALVRWLTPPRLEAQLGDEHSSEVWRAQVAFREVV